VTTIERARPGLKALGLYWVLLESADQTTRRVEMTQRSLSEATGVSVRVILYLIGELEAAGMITRERGRIGVPNAYVLHA
jgi:DNA-binding IscR family transcriptional regulator